MIVASSTDLVNLAIAEITNRYAPIGEIIITLDEKKRYYDYEKKRDKKIWIVGKEWEWKKKIYGRVSYGNYKCGDSYNILSWNESDQTKSFKRSAAKQYSNVVADINLEDIKRHQACKDKWLPRFNAMPIDSDVHLYLKSKNIDQNYIARVDGKTLYIPAYNQNEFVGIQKIYPKDDKWEKRYSSGIKVKGSFCPIGKIREAGYIYITEGYATACSIYMATGVPTVCAWSAGNLFPAIESIKAVNPKCEIVIASDDDPWFCSQCKKKSPNTELRKCPDCGNDRISAGEDAAKLCTDMFPNVRYTLPKFNSRDFKKHTDFNDLHQLEGLDSVKGILTVEKIEPIGISCLGHAEDKYFYTSTSNPGLVTIPIGSHTKQYLTDLMPSKYYFKHFPKLNIEKEVIGINWDKVDDYLKIECRKKGYFNPKLVRSTGAWMDNGEVVINLGDSLHVNGKQVSLQSYKTKHIYIIGPKIPRPTRDMISMDKKRKFLELLELISWADPDAGKLLAGWLVVAPICGALEWRPHIWITGASSSGKSHIAEKILFFMLKDLYNYLQGASTEAGIRQATKSTAMALMIDEFETEDKKSNDRVRFVIELLRQASTDSQASVVKGTSSGRCMSFSPKFAALVSSINVNLINEADKNRFTILDIAKGGPEQYKKLKKLEKELLTPDFAVKFWSRTVFEIDNIKKNIKIIENILEEKYSGHFSRQYASLIGGCVSYMTSDVLSEDMAIDFLDQFDLKEKVIEKKNETECIDYLFSKVIAIDVGGSTSRITIREMIEDAGDSGCYVKSLARFGIYISKGFIYVQNTNVNLKEIFKDTPWISGWSSSLKRLPFVDNNGNKPMRVGGKVDKCCRIPVGEVVR